MVLRAKAVAFILSRARPEKLRALADSICARCSTVNPRCRRRSRACLGVSAATVPREAVDPLPVVGAANAW